MSAFFSYLRKIVSFVFVLAVLATIGYFIYVSVYLPQAPPTPSPTVVSPAPPTITPIHEVPKLHIQEFEIGRFGPDNERKAYVSGSMKLTIPKLNYSGPVLSVDIPSSVSAGVSQGLGTEAIDYQMASEMQTLLDNGVALFNQAQLPGVENRNVSIAGHRDFKGMEFYYINLLTKGDQFYLDYNGKQYVYDYVKTFVTTEDDWDPIATTGESILTLQSCDPPFAPNAVYDRIFVVAQLVNVYDLSKGSGGVVPQTNRSEKEDPLPSTVNQPVPGSKDVFSAKNSLSLPSYNS